MPKKDTHIIVLGGTITCDYKYTESGQRVSETLEPSSTRWSEIMSATVRHVSKTCPELGADKWIDQTRITTSKNPIDSSDFSTSPDAGIANISFLVSKTREVLTNSKARNIFITFGTDTVEYFAQALSEALSTTDMVVTAGQKEVLRKIFILVSDESSAGLQTDEKIAESQPGIVLQSAYLLRDQPSLDGIIGIVRVRNNITHNKSWHVDLLAPRGAKKDRTITPSISSRYETLGYVEGDTLEPLVSDISKVGIAKPRMPLPETVRFKSGQHLITQTPTNSAPKELLERLRSIERDIVPTAAKALRLFGKQGARLARKFARPSLDPDACKVILLALPGAGNLRTAPEYLKKFAEADLMAMELGIPLVLFSEPLQNEYAEYNGMFPSHSSYIGGLEASRKAVAMYMPKNIQPQFISAVPFARSEVDILVSKILGQEGFDQLSFTEKRQKIVSEFGEYSKYVYKQITQ